MKKKPWLPLLAEVPSDLTLGMMTASNWLGNARKESLLVHNELKSWLTQFKNVICASEHRALSA
jgi:hypothetical protein